MFEARLLTVSVALVMNCIEEFFDYDLESVLYIRCVPPSKRRGKSADFLNIQVVPALSYSGIFPCFFLGLVSRLFSRERRAVMSFARV
jgi:hypothetical protein